MGGEGKNACGVAVGGEKSLTGELSGLWADRIEKWVCRLEPCQSVGGVVCELKAREVSQCSTCKAGAFGR